MPVAFKLHSYALEKLGDHNWAGCDMYYHIKDCFKEREQPYDLLKKTLKNGLLQKLGEWFYDEYFNPDWGDSLINCRINKIKQEQKLWYLEDIYEMLTKHKVSQQELLLAQLHQTLDEYDALFQSNETAYFEKLIKDNKKLNRLYFKIYANFKDKFEELKILYAENFGERAFHDRQLCEYISQLLIVSGVCDYDEHENPMQWVIRERWKAWIKPTLLKRENNQCALCKHDFGSFERSPVIDHIVPLAKGGVNDLVNLQILCKNCNNKKYTHEIDTTSSIPRYFQRYLDRNGD